MVIKQAQNRCLEAVHNWLIIFLKIISLKENGTVIIQPYHLSILIFLLIELLERTFDSLKLSWNRARVGILIRPMTICQNLARKLRVMN